MSEKKKILKRASLVGSLTSLSRIFGLLRDMVIARFFGASLATDAFFVAFRIPNVLRRLFAEGALTVSFIPIFKEAQIKGGKGEAKEIPSWAFRRAYLIPSSTARNTSHRGIFPNVRRNLPRSNIDRKSKA